MSNASTKTYAHAMNKLVEKGVPVPRTMARRRERKQREEEESIQAETEGTLIIGEPVPVVPESEPGLTSLDILKELKGPEKLGRKGPGRPRAIFHLNVNMKEYEKIILKAFARKLGLSFADWARRVLLREVKIAIDARRMEVPPLVVLRENEAELMSTVIRGPHRRMYKKKNEQHK